MPGTPQDTEHPLRRAVDALLAVDEFAWQAAQTKGKSGAKAVWAGPGQRKPLYGAAARKALNKPGNAATAAPSRPEPKALPQRPTAPPIPAPVQPAPVIATAPIVTPASAAGAPVAPSPGRAVRAARAAGRGAKAVGKASLTVGAKLQIASAWTVERTMAAVAALGRKLKSLSWLERNTGIGRLVEREASRRQRRAAIVRAAAAAGGLGAGLRAVVEETARMAGLRFRANKKKFGRVAAVVMEGVFLSLSVQKRQRGCCSASRS